MLNAYSKNRDIFAPIFYLSMIRIYIYIIKWDSKFYLLFQNS